MAAEDRPNSPPIRSKSMTQQAFTAYQTVQKYVSELVGKGMKDDEQQERLEVLEEFCQFVGRTPDQMVAEVFDVETQKYKKRNFYSDQVKKFSAQISATWSAQTARGNIVRSFFIANGRRLPNEKPDWL
jgi:site-specific recombinase XerD